MNKVEKSSQTREELLSKKVFSFDDVVQLLEILRAPNGCPWDRAQTHQSIKSNAIEEAYELADAIDNNDVNEMTEEVGDMLLQCVFHMQIGQANNEFNDVDVYNALCNKLISRHSHIFGEDKANSAEQALDTWEKNKKELENITSTASYMKKIPQSTPSLLRAYKIQKRAQKVGFDWDSIEGAFLKLDEEIGETKDAIKEQNSAHIEEELGDTLFALINVFRFCKVEPEACLNKANAKFIRRFEFMENRLKDKGLELENATLEQMEEGWALSKKNGL